MLAWAPFCGVESSDLDVLLGVQFRNINFGGFIFVFLVTDSGDLGFLGFGVAQLSQNCSLLDFVKVDVSSRRSQEVHPCHGSFAAAPWSAWLQPSLVLVLVASVDHTLFTRCSVHQGRISGFLHDPVIVVVEDGLVSGSVVHDSLS